MPYHKQCLIVSEEKPPTYMTRWLPESFAKLKKCVTLPDVEGNWFVIEVYQNHRIESSYIEEHSQDYKKTRKASDV